MVIKNCEIISEHASMK